MGLGEEDLRVSKRGPPIAVCELRCTLYSVFDKICVNGTILFKCLYPHIVYFLTTFCDMQRLMKR